MKTKEKVGIVLALMVCVGLFLWMNRTPGDSNGGPKPPPPIKLSDNVKLLTGHWPELISQSVGGPLGNANAPWTVIEFGDFQCPQCGKAHAYFEQMVQKSKGQVKAYFFNFPLVAKKDHPFAKSGALAAIAAANQGKFWQMYEAMYANQDHLGGDGLRQLATGIKGLDVNKFTSDCASPVTSATLGNEMALDSSVKDRTNADVRATKFVGRGCHALRRNLWSESRSHLSRTGRLDAVKPVARSIPTARYA